MAPHRTTGRDVSRGWSFWVAVGITSIVTAAVVVKLMVQYGPADTRATVLGFRVLDDQSVRVTAVVYRDPRRDAVCLVRARNVFGVEVGHAEVRVVAESGGDPRAHLEHVLPTIDRAVTGEVGRCLSLPQGAPLPFDEDDLLPEPSHRESSARSE